MKTQIETILENIGQDKHQNPSTTSDKFKADVFDFCNEQLQDRGVCVEYGTHKGQTTHVLSYLFDKVITFNLPNGFDEAKRLNKFRTNIEYRGMNLYSSEAAFMTVSDTPVSFFFSDAVHTYNAVKSDYMMSYNCQRTEPCYIVFDDYGLIPDVYNAVNDLIKDGKLEKIKEVGQPKGYDFKNGRVLRHGPEGIICKFID
jgi:hypothetical protein